MARIDLGLVKGKDGKTLTVNGITPDVNGNIKLWADDCGAVEVRQNGRYSSPCSVCAGTPAPAYVRIDITDVAIAAWSMLGIEVSIRHTSVGGGVGKLLIGAVHGSVSEWSESVAYRMGNVGEVEVFLSDRRYIYIKGLREYATVSVDNVLASDAAAKYDMSAMSIDVVDSLPATYQTATMKDLLDSDTFTKYAAPIGHTHAPSDIGAAPAPTISQTDITAGSTALANGKSYHVYE